MKYKLKRKDNQLNAEVSGQWYAMPVYEETISSEQVAKKISERSTISSADMVGVLESFLTILPEYLAKGEPVYLRGLGTFRLSISSEGVEDPKDFDVSLINAFRIIYTPDVKIQNTIAEIIHYEDSDIRGSAAMNITQVLDLSSGTADKIISLGGSVRIMGEKILIKGENASVGLKLLNVESGQEFVVPMSAIPVNKAKEIVFIMPRNVPAGLYKIQIATQVVYASTRISKNVRVCTYDTVLEVVAPSS
ncbi:MAG: DUF4469 domain-containing protein [Tannerellaceae bacterium]|jgi:predicted histone-like DNA-binding protein|nr:DUF4469 domain-containing protein [Tannerellaceae bacterium]